MSSSLSQLYYFFIISFGLYLLNFLDETCVLYVSTVMQRNKNKMHGIG